MGPIAVSSAANNSIAEVSREAKSSIGEWGRMAGHTSFGAPSIHRAFFRGLLLVLSITIGAFGLTATVLWVLYTRLGVGEVAFVAVVSALAGSVVTLVVQGALRTGGEVVERASKQLHNSEIIYCEVEDNGKLAAELIKSPLATGPAVESLSDVGWSRASVELKVGTELDSPDEWASRGKLVAALSKHYSLVARANRELALREKWTLRGALDPGSKQMVPALDRSLITLWATISDEAPGVLRLFPAEVTNRITRV
jgi:hypothetical protein